jgi:hypothetical protein
VLEAGALVLPSASRKGVMPVRRARAFPWRVPFSFQSGLLRTVDPAKGTFVPSRPQETPDTVVALCCSGIADRRNGGVACRQVSGAS